MDHLWCYPWTIADEGPEAVWDRLHSTGIEGINLASHYHSVRSFQPRLRDQPFTAYSGGCFFDTVTDRVDSLEIDPQTNEVPPFDDPLAELVASANQRGISVNGWVVLFHNTELGKTNPDFCTEDVYGTPHYHSFCPSHEAVQTYFSWVVETVSGRGVEEIQLERLGYPLVFHGHGADFGHDKRQILTTATEEILLSQCFCDACQESAVERGYDVTSARERIQSLLDSSFERPQYDLPPLDTLCKRYPVLEKLFEFRESVIHDLAAKLSEASGSTPLNYYVMDGSGVDPDDIWPSGVTFDVLNSHVDRVTALCYVRDPSVARQRIVSVQSLFDGPVDAGVTLDPEVLRTSEALEAVVDAVKAESSGRTHVYHHSLMTETHMNWLDSVL